METQSPLSQSGDAAVLTKLIRPHADDLPVDEAKALLNIRFDKRELDHIHELATKNRTTPSRPPRRPI